jgi:hypothetical protein
LRPVCKSRSWGSLSFYIFEHLTFWGPIISYEVRGLRAKHTLHTWFLRHWFKIIIQQKKKKKLNFLFIYSIFHFYSNIQRLIILLEYLTVIYQACYLIFNALYVIHIVFIQSIICDDLVHIVFFIWYNTTIYYIGNINY